jgi:hypothetical protein
MNGSGCLAHGRTIGVVAAGRARPFVPAGACRLWFEGARAGRRCLHPLDPVAVVCRGEGTALVARAILDRGPRRTAG